MNNKSSSLSSLREKILANQDQQTEKKELPPISSDKKKGEDTPSTSQTSSGGTPIPSSLSSLKPSGLPPREKTTSEKKPLPSLKPSTGGLSQKFPPKDAPTKSGYQTLDIPSKRPSIKSVKPEDAIVEEVLSAKPEPKEKIESQEAAPSEAEQVVETKTAPDNTFLQKLMASAQSQQEKDTSFFQKVNVLDKQSTPNIAKKTKEVEDNQTQMQNVSINKKQIEEFETLKRKVVTLQEELDALRIKYNKILSVRYRNTLVLNPNTNDLSEGFLDIIKKASSTQLYDEFNHLQAEILELKYQHQEKKENEVFLRKQIRELQAMLGEREVAIANLRVQFVEITQKYTSATEHYKQLNEKNIHQIKNLNEEVRSLKDNIKHIYDYSGKFYDRLFKDFHQRLDMEIYRYDEVIKTLEANIEKQKVIYQDDLNEYVQNEKKWIMILQEKEDEIRDLEKRLRSKYEYSIQKIQRQNEKVPTHLLEYRSEKEPKRTELSPSQKQAKVNQQVEFSTVKKNLDNRIKELYSMEGQLKEKQSEIKKNLHKNYEDIVVSKDEDRKYIMSEYDARLDKISSVEQDLNDFDQELSNNVTAYNQSLSDFEDTLYNRQMIVAAARRALVNTDPSAAQNLKLEDAVKNKLMQLISLKKMIESRFTNREQLLKIKIDNVRDEKSKMQSEIAKTKKNMDRLQASYRRERNYTTAKQEEYESDLNKLQSSLHEYNMRLERLTVDDEMKLKTQYLNLSEEKTREVQHFESLEKEFFKGLASKYQKGN